ncbi:antA/AntB antirepressor family protein [Bartonella ancashensis]|uniref:Phage antirepressor protein n=3 Tax=Bartonella ancashensis TaxID=1318743 RepID=A0A0M5KUH1_9HYPH|nr:antA/AntB antirepressor family protein [Bartonella ancashensis]ALE03423.1 Phage antirepressor protein [Bartonella ancashensis]ALE03488.1 Phage antirepressor protein [Bartonella ancashensis]
MEELITIHHNTIKQDTIQTVNARELHAFLEVGRDFTNWIKNRIKKYSFIENRDYIVFANFGENLQGGRPSKDYALTLDMAKELSMVERNEKGRQARHYFIECEKLAKQIAAPRIDYSNPEVMLGFVTYLKSENERKDSIIAKLEPKAQALEQLSRSDSLLCITNAAKILEMRPKDLFNRLQEKKWIYKRTAKSSFIPHQDKMNIGVIDYPMTIITKPDGSELTVAQAKITSKGLSVLSQELRKNSMH